MKEPSGLIRVALDSGGIAAGAAAVFDELRELTAKYSEIKVIAVGTPGMCYADAQAEFLIEGRPHLHFGRLTGQNVRQIFEEFVVKGRMPAPNSVHEYVVLGARSPGHELPQAVASIVCADTQQHGDQDLVALLKACVGPETEIIEVADFGFYNRGFALQFFPGGLMLADLARDDIAHAVAMVRRGVIPDVGTVVREAAQLRIASRNCGLIDPESIAAYEAARGYIALKRALQKSPANVVNEVLASGLRGRGGAGFSTGKKWQLSAAETAHEKYVICNGDEGDPHRVLEGLIIAGFATGANQGYFYIRAEYPLATARVQKAIDAAVSAGYLGKNILGSSFSFEARVRLGAGAYVCGEETALIASVEGKRGSPHPRPPYPSVRGLHRAPTTINNVETLATVPEILAGGGAWYAGIGEGKSKGTKLFAVSGKIRRTQLVEVQLGTSVRDVVENLCGGIVAEKKIKAVQTGGPSGGFVPGHLLDTPLTSEAMSALGSIIGSGGMIVLDEDVNMVELIAHAMQSASLCGLGKSAPSPLIATLKYFHPSMKYA